MADMFIAISTHAFGWQPLKGKNCIRWCGAPAPKPGFPGSLLTCPSVKESTDTPGNALGLFTGQPEILFTLTCVRSWSSKPNQSLLSAFAKSCAKLQRTPYSSDE